MLLTLRILVWRGRRAFLIAGLVAVACLLARQAAPPPERSNAVTVAARDLQVGDLLTADDLRVVRMPTRLVPHGTLTAAELPGRRVTASVPAGLPLVPGVVGGVLVDGRLADDARFGLAAPAGTVTVPVRLVDPSVARMLRSGDRIDLVAPDDALTGPGIATPDGAPEDGGDGPRVLARAALVLDVVTAAAEDGDGLAGWTGSEPADEPLVLVAVAPEEGHRLAAAGWGSLGAVVVEGS